MQTTINVTIGGKVFHVEEPAYAKLKAYLDDLHRRFATHADGEEIVEDIEQAISGHMAERLNPGKEAITEADVVEMIAQMGGADELADEPKQEESKTHTQANAPKRLFRDTETGVIGGVSAGLSAYLGLDVTLIRVLFVVVTILGGWGILVYLLLWLLVPEAKTVSDKMMMSGEPVTVASIEESARAMFARAKEMSPKRRHLEDVMTNMGILIRRLLSIAQSVLGIVIAVFASIGLILATIIGVVAFFRFERFDIDPIAKEVFALMNTKLLAVSGWVFLIIPLIIGIALGVSLLKKKNIFRPIPVFAGIALWILAASALAITAVDVVPEIERLEREYLEQHPAITQTVEFDDFTNVVISSNGNTSIRQGEEFAISIFADDLSFQDLNIWQANDTLYIERTCEYSCYRSAEVSIVMPQLDRIDAEGAGRLTVDGFDQEEMSITLRGVIEVIADGAVDNLHLSGDGLVQFDGTEFVAEETSLFSDGPSNWQLNTAVLTGEASGGADVHIVGDHQDDASTEDFIVDYVSNVLGGAGRDSEEVKIQIRDLE